MERRSVFGRMGKQRLLFMAQPGNANAKPRRSFRQIACAVGAIVALIILINWNVSQLQMSSSLSSPSTQSMLANTGKVELLSGAKVQTAVALQGDAQCVSQYKSDSSTATCQGFCSAKFKKFHCAWCKCRACAFCPRGGEAIEGAEQLSLHSPPPPPAPNSSAPLGALLTPLAAMTADPNATTGATRVQLASPSSSPAAAGESLDTPQESAAIPGHPGTPAHPASAEAVPGTEALHGGNYTRTASGAANATTAVNVVGSTGVAVVPNLVGAAEAVVATANSLINANVNSIGHNNSNSDSDGLAVPASVPEATTSPPPTQALEGAATMAGVTAAVTAAVTTAVTTSQPANSTIAFEDMMATASEESTALDQEAQQEEITFIAQEVNATREEEGVHIELAPLAAEPANKSAVDATRHGIVPTSAAAVTVEIALK